MVKYQLIFWSNFWS